MIEEINFKLEQLREYVNLLKEYQSCDIEEIKGDRTLRGAKIYGNLPCLHDICEMIISGEKLRSPHSY